MFHTVIKSAAFFMLLTTIAASVDAQPVSSGALANLHAGHPRLMLLDGTLESLKARYATDVTLKRYVDESLAQADEILAAAPLTYDKIGPRLLHVSRECLRRVYALALAYRWTGEKRYAAKALENMQTVCAFKNWNDSHFLDVAEMCHAVGIGYDWLYDTIPSGDREAIRKKLIEYGLQEGVEEYEHWEGWPDSEHNWNQVCNSGLIIGALAIAEDAPDYAEKILGNAIKSLPHSLETYGPDGAWPEGPAYWHYATRYTAFGLCALETALGATFDLDRFPGMMETGLFPDYTTGPTGLYLNFADSGEKSRRGGMPCMFWLANHYGNPAISNLEHAVLASERATPQHVMWYVAPTTAAPVLALDRLFDGPVPVAVFRSAWGDPKTLFLGVKAGYNQVNHGHLDLGGFELDALGVRWARDLGSDDYNLPAYFDKKVGGRRWNYYRLRSISHSVPLIDGKDQTQDGTSKVVDFRAGEKPGITLDLSGAYIGRASRVSRTLQLVQDRKAMECEDRFEFDAELPVTWAMTTDATIELQGARALLTLEGQRLVAEILEPANATFSHESAEQSKPEKANTGVRRLLVALPASGKNVTIRVRLSPQWAP